MRVLMGEAEDVSSLGDRKDKAAQELGRKGGAAREGDDARTSLRNCKGGCGETVGQGIVSEFSWYFWTGYRGKLRNHSEDAVTVRTMDQAKEDLALHLKPLGALMDAAHAEFQNECRSIAHKLDARSRASIYRDLIIRNLREYCDETPGATTHRKGQLTLVGLENNWLLRVKRLRQGFAVAVSPTHASRDYDANQVPASMIDLFPADVGATCIYFGWSVAENAPGSISKFLVCNDENRQMAWALPLDESDSPPPAVVDLPLEPSAPSEPPRVRVKGAPKRKVNE
jgi:hypothetical protein